MSVKVTIVKATNLKNMDSGLSGKTDAYVTFYAEGQYYASKVINDNLNPVWNQSFTVPIQDPGSLIYLNVWDNDNWTNDDLMGGNAISLASLVMNEPTCFDLPILRRKKDPSYGVFTVQVTADFSGLKGVVQQLQQTEQHLAAQVAELRALNQSLQEQVERFTEENDRYKQLNDQLTSTSEQLQSSVKQLEQNVTQFTEENEKLQSTRQDLEENVAHLSNKIGVLSGELNNLQKTREMLDEQVTRQEEQNQQLAFELTQLHSIEEGMKQFAAQQGDDYKVFVDKLTSSLSHHQKLIQDFSNENQKLKKNRRQIQIDSLLSLSNSFQNWDKKVGLSTEEFQSYLEMIGPEFQEILKAKFGSMEEVFVKLDADRSGTLNISELRTLLNDLVVDSDNQ